MRLAAKETHNSFHHSKKKETSKTTLSGVLAGFPLSGLPNAAPHLCCVPDTPVTTGTSLKKQNSRRALQLVTLYAVADQSADLLRSLRTANDTLPK